MQFKPVAVLILLLGLSLAAGAVTPQFWENFTQAELLEGSLQRVSLTPEGSLFQAPAYDLVYRTGQSYIFSMVRDKSGNLYIGTGDEGKVFKIDPQGRGSLYFQAKELNIFALALDPSGALYAGTSPDGKIYKISSGEQAEVFCDPEAKYIWAMVFDEAGNLYVGTGANGIIYKVDKNGEKSVFYTCSDTHVRCLLMENRKLLAGTSPGGLVVQIDQEAKGFALVDSPLEEVHALTVDRYGTVFAVAASAAEAAAGTPAKPAESSTATTVITTVTSVVGLAGKVDGTKGAAAPEAQGAGSARTAIYAISRDGSVETLYESDVQMAFDALVRDDGSLLVATGPKGRILEVNAARQVTVLTDSPEEDATHLLAAGDVVYVGASNQGNVYALQPRPASSGTYESKALDAKVVASWGKISWHMDNARSAAVEISTRTGNTEKADNSWSDWSAPYKAPGELIRSPRARYLQWRAVFQSSSGAATAAAAGKLGRVQIAYLQQNMRPQVTELEVLPHGVELVKQPSLAMSGMGMVSPAATTFGRSLNAPRERGREQQPMAPRQELRPGTQSFTWKGTDGNEDALEYALYFRGEDEADWKILEKKVTDTFYTLHAATLPDGTYRLKVVANDSPSNAYDRFQIGEAISDPFVVSSVTPRIEILNRMVQGRRVTAQFRASVSAGCVATAEFSVDGGDWRLVFPVDGIADSTREEYLLATPELSPGEHLIGVRASDRNGLTGTERLVMKVP